MEIQKQGIKDDDRIFSIDICGIGELIIEKDAEGFVEISSYY